MEKFGRSIDATTDLSLRIEEEVAQQALVPAFVAGLQKASTSLVEQDLDLIRVLDCVSVYAFSAVLRGAACSCMRACMCARHSESGRWGRWRREGRGGAEIEDRQRTEREGRVKEGGERGKRP